MRRTQIGVCLLCFLNAVGAVEVAEAHNKPMLLAMSEWLDRDLTTNTLSWTIAYWHIDDSGQVQDFFSIETPVAD